MTPALPSLEVHPYGACCPRCHAPLELVGMCGACGWDEARERAIRADHDSARKRARAWQLGRGVQS